MLHPLRCVQRGRVGIVSLWDYRASNVIAAEGWSFDAVIMAAYRRADSNNAVLLRTAWPHLCAELDARYNAPGGLLEGESS